MKYKQLFYKLLIPFAWLYWRVFKPQSFGVKVLICLPDNEDEVLLIRHSYGDTSLWNLPGGGYKPKHEYAETAAKRELEEELGITEVHLSSLGEYQTSEEGKRDTVTVFLGTISSAEIQPTTEVAELAWVRRESLASREEDVARVARRAVAMAFSHE